MKDAIARGDVYQVNLVQHLSAPFAGDPRGARAGARAAPPALPAPLVGDGWAIVSASPELFLARRGNRVWTMPIKGTRPQGEADDLRESEKDAAEHVMIVDLERNDLSRVCVPGTVRWPELMVERELAGVVHLVSTVEGRLAPASALPSCSTRCSRADRSPAHRRSRRSITSPRSSRSAAARRWAPSAPSGRTATSSWRSRSGRSPSRRAASTSGSAAASSGTPSRTRRSRSRG